MSDIPEIQEVVLLSLIISVKCPGCGVQMMRGASTLGKDCSCLSCGQPYRLPNGLVLYAAGRVPDATPAAAEQFLRETRNPDYDPDAVAQRYIDVSRQPANPGDCNFNDADRKLGDVHCTGHVDYRLCDGDIDD